LKIIPHPNPYKVSWLKRGQQVTVVEQCLLSFQIRNFSEQVFCDIVDMDACHVLIERPWLFDIKVFHDGRKNTYEFLKDGKRYRLESMVETKLSGNDRKEKECKNMCSKSDIMLCLTKEFLREQKKKNLYLALVPGEVLEIEKMSLVPLEIQPLLNEFKDIVGDDLPTCLSPLRSISHQIDLILRSRLPNKYPYRMTPMKNEEVNKQVQKLLDRGFISENLSLCVTVPTILTPKKGGEWRMCTNS
jgi:hypothetical protein